MAITKEKAFEITDPFVTIGQQDRFTLVTMPLVSWVASVSCTY